jgi:DNA-binding MarR family transcriptional regulator
MLTTSDPVTTANALRPVLLKLNRQLRKELGPVGITGGQAALLHMIKTRPGIGVRELAGLEGVSAPAMCGYVDRLEAAGLVRRVRSQEDRRRVGLELTDSGRSVWKSARSRRTAWLATRLQRLSGDEIATIEAALPALGRLLEEPGPQ